MAQAKSTTLPPMVPFPEAAWRQHLVPEEWEACLDAWIVLTQAHLSLPAAEFLRTSVKDESVAAFLSSYALHNAISQDLPLSTDLLRAKKLRKLCFMLSSRLLDVDSPPEILLQWEFLADFSKLYGRSSTQPIITKLWKAHSPYIEFSLSLIKTTLSKDLDAGLKGDLRTPTTNLKRLNHLIHASSHVAAFLTAGSDFLDALIVAYKIMNPPLRKIIISTTYLCLIGLTEGETPKFSSLIDVLYELKAAADAHKAGPTNVNDSLVAELVTVTPVLKQLQQRIEANASGSTRAKSVFSALGEFRKQAPSGIPVRARKKKVDKGKGIGKRGGSDDEFGHGGGEVHVHRMSLISEVQDLFPELGAGFVMKLLDEYDENVEEVVSHLLEGTLPAHLKDANQSEALAARPRSKPSLAPHTPTLPTRRNIHDNDAFDTLSISASRLHLGRHSNTRTTAETLLNDRTYAPSKAAILSALAAFDSDDDERDDTYDVEDVGGTVDAAAPAGSGAEDARALGDARYRPGGGQSQSTRDEENDYDELLFKIWKASPGVFARDAATRRGKEREKLKAESGLTDEAIEGWAVMIGREPGRLRRLERRFEDRGVVNAGGHGQRELAGTRWRNEEDTGTGTGTETEGEGGSGSGGGGRGGQRGGRGMGRGRGRGRGGDVAGQTGEKGTEVARQRKEANKGSRANHNRRDQRARKMARGGFGAA